MYSFAMASRFPVRINKYLAERHIASRRKADELVLKGYVRINGAVAKLGDVVREADLVELDKNIASVQKELVYFAFNKPRGIVTHSPSEGQSDIASLSKFSKSVVPIGRLDKDSEGLILLSNDGRIVRGLLEPGALKEKEYEVAVDKKVLGGDLVKMEKGVRIERYTTKPAKARRLSDRTFRLTLTEGKKHQVRRMCAALGYQVRSLKRIRVGNILLGKLPSGKVRRIEGAELSRLLESAGIPTPRG